MFWLSGKHAETRDYIIIMMSVKVFELTKLMMLFVLLLKFKYNRNIQSNVTTDHRKT